jgi:hypothetical protein
MSDTITLDDGRVFPCHGGKVFSWSIGLYRCPECGNNQVFPCRRDEEFEFDFNGAQYRAVARSVPVEACKSCGLEASGPAAAIIRHAAMCSAAGLLSPDEYRAIRTDAGLCVNELSAATGFCETEIDRVERGRMIPDLTYHKTMVAIRDCQAYREYLKGQK